MKKLILFFIVLASVSASYSQNKNFGKGYYRVSYYNVYDCKTELQSFDSSITEKKLQNLRSFLYKFGAKDRGIELEFPTYRTYDFTKRSDTKKKLAAFGKNQVKLFEQSLVKLKKAPVEKEFEHLKQELVNNHTKRIEFEKIFRDWFVSGDDAELRKRVLAYYSDAYVIATLDKTLKLEGLDKLLYTYAEVYDLVFARIFDYDRYKHLQNKTLHDYKIEIVLDHCSKS